MSIPTLDRVDEVVHIFYLLPLLVWSPWVRVIHFVVVKPTSSYEFLAEI